MSRILNLSRRRFIKTSAIAGGGLILGVYLPRLDANTDEAKPGTAFAPNAFVRIDKDGSITIIINHSEMGQGVYTSLAMIVAEELDADWKKIRVEAAPVDPVYNHTAFGLQLTGGSTSIRTEWDRLRSVGAAAKAMLLAAAAADWGVPPMECRAENSEIIHDASKRRSSYGSLVEKASKLSPPAKVSLKEPKDFRIIGKPTKRLDTPGKIDGSALFGLDVNVPGMLVAVVARPPVFGGKLKSFKADKAKAVKGVRHVVEIDRGVAVVGDGFWAAKQGRDALEIEWDDGSMHTFNTADQSADYAEMARKPGAVAKRLGDADAAISGSEKRVEAVYDLPYLAHAPMEPLNCVADVRKESCEIWVGTQSQTLDRMAAAKAAGLDPEKVELHTTLLGGGFGRRAVLDSHFVVEAVQVSKAVKSPVKVMWTREDDIRGGFYRPKFHHRLEGAIDADGNVAGLKDRVVSQSIVVGTPFEAAMVHDGVDDLAVEGVADTPYAIPNLLVEWHQAPSGIPCLWWRSVGHSANAFVMESFIDELAHAAGRDPYDLRKALLKDHPRHLRVLEMATSKAGWGKPLPKGSGRGLAVHHSFESFVAEVAEVSVSKSGSVKVNRVVAAIDCGPVVNPDTVKAQMEGAIVFGLSAALHGEITFEKGRVQQSNFHDYPVLRIDEMPVVETHIIDSKDSMGGVGEPGVPPIAPAIANAIFAATGKRVRRLPIDTHELASG